MFTFFLVIISYTIIWLGGVYFILHRLHMIHRRTEQRVHEYDGAYMMPHYRKPTIFTIIYVLSAYFLSILIIILLIKP